MSELEKAAAGYFTIRWETGPDRFAWAHEREIVFSLVGEDLKTCGVYTCVAISGVSSNGIHFLGHINSADILGTTFQNMLVAIR